MQLRLLNVQHLRVLQAMRVEPHPRINLIVGPNGSGKSSVLEAISLLGRGRSFRTHRAKVLIQYGHTAATIFGRFVDAGGRERSVAMEKGIKGTAIKIDGERCKQVAVLAQTVPVVVVSPDSYDLVAGGPKERRRLLDWSLFHVEQDYLALWQRYHRALKQRNALLRQGKPAAELVGWEKEMGLAGGALHQARQRCAEAIGGLFSEIAVPGVPQVEFTYAPGWDQGLALSEALAKHRQTDLRQGITQVGPHRADLRLAVAGIPVNENLSRGQTKLVVATLLSAHVRFVQSKREMSPILLIDDFGTDLDDQAKRLLGGIVADLGAQLFVTATTRDLLPPWPEADSQVFHVERGEVRKMV